MRIKMNNAYITPRKGCDLKKYYSPILEYPKNILLIVGIVWCFLKYFSDRDLKRNSITQVAVQNRTVSQGVRQDPTGTNDTVNTERIRRDFDLKFNVQDF